MTKITYSLMFLCCSIYSFAQVGIGTTTPDASSILDVSSSSQGFLAPRMTQVQRDAITSPARGLLIFNMDSNCFQYYKGTSWSGCLGESLAQTNKLDCTSARSNGTCTVATPLTNVTTITIDVIVNSYDTYNITTNTVNGYSFSAAGAFSSLGPNTITLIGSGTPLAAQTDTFTIDFTGTGFTCNVDVTVLGGYLANCLEYFNAGFTTDGIYTIDPDGLGRNSPYDCYCDMTNDGGGWTLVFNHNTAGGYWANNTQSREYNIASPGLTTNKYSILSKLDEIKSAVRYEFRLHYPSLGLTNHWLQRFDPRSGGSFRDPVRGYAPISIDMTSNNWGGLESDLRGSYLGGSIGRRDQYYLIGSRDWYGGIRAGNSITDHVQLFVR